MPIPTYILPTQSTYLEADSRIQTIRAEPIVTVPRSTIPPIPHASVCLLLIFNCGNTARSCMVGMLFNSHLTTVKSHLTCKVSGTPII